MQAVKALPSSWQRKLTPACVSLKLKLALIWLVGLAGAEVIVGGGGAATRSMIKDQRGPFSKSVNGFGHFRFTPEKTWLERAKFYLAPEGP